MKSLNSNHKITRRNIMSIIVPCRNVATGQFELIPGQYPLNQALVDTIELMLQEKDLTSQLMSRQANFKYTFNTISLVNTNTRFLHPNTEQGVLYYERGKIYIAPDVIAKTVAEIWVENRMFNSSYAVNGTIGLLMTIMHEATHSRVHHLFSPQGNETEDNAFDREEEQVIKYTKRQVIEFVKKYHLSLECLSLMKGLVEQELVKDEVIGKALIEAQHAWAMDKVVAINKDGTAMLSIQQEYKKQYEPRESWVCHSTSVTLGLALIKKEEQEEKAFQELLAANTPKPEDPPEVLVSVAPVAIPAPPVTNVPLPPVASTPLPPKTNIPLPPSNIPLPPADNIPMPPAPPMSVYEEDWDAELLQATKAEATKAVHPSVIARAIQNSPTYASVLPAQVAPDMDLLIQKVGYEIFNHIFTQCGWDKDSATGFTNTDGVFKEIDLSSIEGIDNAVVSCVAWNAGGNSEVVPFNKSIRGRKSADKNIPIYEVTFNNNGNQVLRRFLPQNINAKNDKNLPSSPAKQAREKGTRIMWVLEPTISNTDVTAARSFGYRSTRFVGKWEEYNYRKIA
jgi:hypothetical protein